MRKFFFGVVFLFIVISLIVLHLDKPSKSMVHLLTVYKDYSRIITKPEETISIPIYSDYEDTFLLDKEAITSSYISNEINSLEIKIDNIRKTEDINKLDEETYTLYYIDISFPYNLTSEQIIDISDCKLSLTYINDESIDLEIGNMYLMFNPIEENNQISLYRMFALTNFYNGKEFISAIVFGLTNMTCENIKITEIDNNIQTMNLDIDEAKFIDEINNVHESIESIIRHEYNPIGIISFSTSIDLINDKLLVVPIKYEDVIQTTNRFPLIIKYIYQDKEYSYIIDDFMFFETHNTLEDYYGSIREFIYNY